GYFELAVIRLICQRAAIRLVLIVHSGLLHWFRSNQGFSIRSISVYIPEVTRAIFPDQPSFLPDRGNQVRMMHIDSYEWPVLQTAVVAREYGWMKLRGFLLLPVHGIRGVTVQADHCSIYSGRDEQ